MTQEVLELLLAGLAGFASGFFTSIPIGPIGITIVNEGARQGFRWAAMIGFGAIAMDFIYCTVAFAGFSSLSTSKLLRAAMELLSFLATIYLGIKYLIAKELPATTPSVERVEHRLHPHTAFMIGFVRVLGNPAVFLFWITLAAAFISHRIVEDSFLSKSVCVIGMSSGAFAWFILLAYLVSRRRGQFSTQTLIRMSHVSGAALLLVAVWIGIRLIKILAQVRNH